MGKVYDALRRAEAQRGRQVAGGIAPTSPVEWSPPPVQAAARKLPFWKRWFQRRAIVEGPEDAAAANKRRISLLQPDSFAAEQFRTLRARIDSLATERPIRIISMASALSGEGKTTAAVNFAVVTAMSLGRRALLVDCDLRKPKIHRALGLRPEAGLAEVLAGEAPLEKAITKVEGVELDVLPVRSQPPNPSELLASPRMRELVEELGRRYDLVILDTPAALALPDAKIVSELSDGIVLVVRADSTPQQEVQATLDILDRRRVLGVLLNAARVDQSYYGYSS